MAYLRTVMGDQNQSKIINGKAQLYSMTIQSNIVMQGAGQRSFLMDDYRPESVRANVVFCHGFKGFKDWGFWDHLARNFSDKGFRFVKFNFSHNGTTVDNPLDFDDLEAFGRNTFSKELQDLEQVIGQLDNAPLFLMGHSRGAAPCMLQTAKDSRVSGLINLAGVSDIKHYWNPNWQEFWSKGDPVLIPNARTGQQMPIYADIFEDYQENAEKLDIEKNLAKIEVPILLLHGDEDPVVPLSQAEFIAERNRHARVHVIQGADHVFGGRHPWEKAELPPHGQELNDVALDFIESCLA